MLAKRYFDLRAEALGARPFSGVVWTFATNCRTRKAYSEADRSSAEHEKRKSNKRKSNQKEINKEKSCPMSPYNPPKGQTGQDIKNLRRLKGQDRTLKII